MTIIRTWGGGSLPPLNLSLENFALFVRNIANKEGGIYEEKSVTIQKWQSQLTALGLDSDAVFHRSKLILKIYRDVVWVLNERVEELQEYACELGKQDIDAGLCYLEISPWISTFWNLRKRYTVRYKVECLWK